MGSGFFRFLALVSITCVPALAGTYSFGGGCASVGAWSQAALTQTKTILGIVETLKNDPNCKGIESIVPKLKIAEDALNTPEGETKRTDRIESIPNEMNALRNFAVASPQLKSEVFKLLTARTLEGASLAAETAKVEGVTAAAGAAANPAAAAIAVGLKDLSTRVRRTALTGMDMMDQVFTVLPSYDRCLIGNPDQGMALLAASVKMAAAFVSSQEGVTSRLGNSIANLVTMVRNRKFTTALRKLDQSEFWLSMSCLMETTSQTYCAARDARQLLDYSIANLKPNRNKRGEPTVDNPLEGYYILSHDIPKVSQWIQKIQFGIRPKLSTDAVFKNRVLQDVNGLMMDIYSIQGTYSEELLTYSTLKDLGSKQNALLKLIKGLTARLAGGSETNGHVNFFTTATHEDMIPFKLIGLTVMPNECRPPKDGETRIPVSWDQWMLNGGQFQGPFQDPDQLSKVIGQQLERLMDQALNQASLYFQQRMIVDMPNLVNESVTNQTVTVVESLQRITFYLKNLQKKILDSDGDLILIPTIQDTRVRIKKVLDSYENIRTIARTALENEDLGLSEEIKKAYASVIESAFEQFNILLQRDTFLSNRLSTLIQYDYALRIKQDEDLGKWENQILLESGNEMLFRLLSSTGHNPTMMKNDLASAQVVNKRNLETIEQVFSDSLYPTLEELGYIADGQQPANSFLNLRTLSRLNQDYWGDQGYFGSWGGFWAFYLGGPSAYAVLPWTRRMFHPELYPFHVSTQPAIRGADDEFGSFDQFKAKLCIQTLSFEDRKKFEPICKGAILRSAFDLNKVGRNSEMAKMGLNIHYNSYMSEPFRSWPVRGESICAFQDYARRNLVYWMTLDLQNSKEE
ncbi:MAG: hypothetical protein ACKOA8_02965 [Deltaproteobacteria bacterium]